MQNKIDKSFFWGDNYISGLTSFGNYEEELNRLIAQYQPEFFERLFGEVVTIDDDSPLLKYVIDEETKTSPLANYIFCIYKENNATTATNTGDKALNTNGATNVDYRIKAVRSWNMMVKQNQIIHNKLYQLENIEGISYLNDILLNMGNDVRYIENNNQTNGIILKGGIFQNKTIYDYQK